MKTDNLSTAEKDIIARYLLKCYRVSRENVEYLKECDLIRENMESYRTDKKTILLIERALNEMEESSREFLIREFYEKRKTGMMESEYSKSSYYRKRARAVDNFLRCL